MPTMRQWDCVRYHHRRVRGVVTQVGSSRGGEVVTDRLAEAPALITYTVHRRTRYSRRCYLQATNAALLRSLPECCCHGRLSWIAG